MDKWKCFLIIKGVILPVFRFSFSTVVNTVCALVKMLTGNGIAASFIIQAIAV